MPDPLARLQRPIVAEHLLVPTGFVDGLIKRAERVDEPRFELPERRERLGLEVRSVSVGLRPEPNAPLLIRLIRKPYSLETVRPGRVASGREKAEPVTRTTHRVEFVESLRSTERTEHSNPVRGRARPEVPRIERGLASRWLTGRGPAASDQGGAR